MAGNKRNQIIILLANHSPTRMPGIQSRLKRQGFELLKSNNIPDTVELFEEKQPDLVVLKPTVEPVPEYELASFCQDAGQGTKIILLLKSIPDLQSETSYWSGISDFYVGNSPAELQARIELALFQRKENFALQEKLKLLEEQSIKDYKTGLYNDRFIFRRLIEEFQRTERYGIALSIIMVDLDEFKGLNDTEGHPFGDFVLQKFAIQLGELIRKIDIPGRYGGDEFLILLPYTGLDDATIIADRMRAHVENHTFEKDGHRRRITISQGINTYSGDGSITCAEFLKGADKAVLEAKRRGRNRVCLYPIIREKPEE
jgi:diguanylate cyclase (GGDEF)-like protein